jgi:hypothetical protein
MSMKLSTHGTKSFSTCSIAIYSITSQVASMADNYINGSSSLRKSSNSGK